MLRLLVTNGLEQGRALRLKPGANRIGRALENHFQIADPSISGRHCEVVFSDDGIRVRDLNSTNGTCVDGVRIQEGYLAAGQVLQVGNVDLRLEEVDIDTDGPAVKVPDVFMGKKGPTLLPDGMPACGNHPELAATYRCAKCQETLCESCVRVVRKVSGDALVFCSLCSGLCTPLLETHEVHPSTAGTKKGFLRRLTQTLKLRAKQRARLL